LLLEQRQHHRQRHQAAESGSRRVEVDGDTQLRELIWVDSVLRYPLTREESSTGHHRQPRRSQLELQAATERHCDRSRLSLLGTQSRNEQEDESEDRRNGCRDRTDAENDGESTSCSRRQIVKMAAPTCRSATTEGRTCHWFSPPV
jgi:hypothetical protein